MYLQGEQRRKGPRSMVVHADSVATAVEPMGDRGMLTGTKASTARASSDTLESTRNVRGKRRESRLSKKQ